MEQVYLKTLEILDVRNLQGISVELSETEKKHLVLTGKNGSGKTSVLSALAHHLQEMVTDESFLNAKSLILFSEKKIKRKKENKTNEKELFETEKQLEFWQKKYSEGARGTQFSLNISLESMYTKFQKGEFLLAFYEAERSLKTTVVSHVEKVHLKEKYGVHETPRTEFNKFLADLKVTVALAESDNDREEADEIKVWFQKFEEMLQKLFEDPTLKLVFVRDTFTFELQSEKKPAFTFNTLSSGYAAVLDIVVDLILRMQQKVKRKFVFDMPGIVLIDEIETHLHLQLQRNIMPMLTTLFPKIQFILSTHSPFILNSLDEAVIYDLEQKLLVQEGMTHLSYQGIVDGYFGAKEMSDFIQEKFDRYKSLVQQKEISGEELVEIARLEVVLSEIPNFLSLDFATAFQRIKHGFDLREDV